MEATCKFAGVRYANVDKMKEWRGIGSSSRRFCTESDSLNLRLNVER